MEKEITFTMPAHSKRWNKLIDSHENKWMEDQGNEDEKISSSDVIKAGDILTCRAGSTLMYCNLEKLSKI